MNKNHIKNLAHHENFIPGIYNYCDRWCERCPFTERCMNFAMTREQTGDPETSDISNEKFWQSISDILKATRELLEESAEEMGIDLDAIDLTESDREEGIKDKITENHECCRAAKKYYQMVADFFESEYIPSLQVVDKEHVENAAEHQKNNVLGGPPTLDEMVEIIYWYHHFVYVKLMRAVRGTLGNAGEEWGDFPKDSDGSAKVALIAIDRSMAAWGHMHRFFPSHQDQIMEIIVHLERLRNRTEILFPEARRFVRPGFDEV
jgi:hypothetical protein